MTPDSPESIKQSDNPPRICRLKDQLEILAKAGAALLVLFYVLGFIVVSAADGKHGIINFSIFRARVVAAGVLAALFLGLAFWMWEGTFGLGGLQKLVKGMHWQAGENAGKRGVPYSYRCLSYLIVTRSASASIYLFLLRKVPGQFFGWRVLIVVVAAAIAATIPIVLKKHPVLASATCWIAAVGFLALEVFFQVKVGIDFIFDGFLVFAVIAETQDTHLQRVSDLREINWITAITNLVILPVLFGLYLFEAIPPSFGGGKPVVAVIQFAGTSPIDGAAKDKVWLLDEGESGFYVLQASPEDKKGIFLPRSSVAAIYFDATADASASGQGKKE
jgi:hypothetical protein